MLRTRLQIAKADILRHFDELPKKVLKQPEIARILSEQRGFWRLAQRTNTSEFINFLVSAGRLKRYDFRFPSRPAHSYTWGDVPLLEIVLSLRPRSFISHYTAMRFHGLTEQAPKTLYITHEHQAPSYGKGRNTLSQDSVDAAFRKPARVTQDIVDHGDHRICLIGGMNTGLLGIIDAQTSTDTSTPANIRVTNVERTLIDITVRPVYSGGVAEVLKAFKEAKPKVSANRLRAMLHKLEYVYPYHQAIGFYLERAGYSEASIELFRQLPQPIAFYLASEMSEVQHIREWNLFVPKGL